MLLAEIRLDGSIERRKNLPPFLTVSRYLVPSPPSFSGMLFLSLSLPFSFSFSFCLASIPADVKRGEHLLVAYGTFGQTRPLSVSHRDTLSKGTNGPRVNQTRGIDQTRIDPFHPFLTQRFPERLRFATRCLLRLASRLRVKRTLHIGTLQASPRDSDCLDEISSGSFIRSYTTV